MYILWVKKLVFGGEGLARLDGTCFSQLFGIHVVGRKGQLEATTGYCFSSTNFFSNITVSNNSTLKGFNSTNNFCDQARVFYFQLSNVLRLCQRGLPVVPNLYYTVVSCQWNLIHPYCLPSSRYLHVPYVFLCKSASRAIFSCMASIEIR